MPTSALPRRFRSSPAVPAWRASTLCSLVFLAGGALPANAPPWVVEPRSPAPGETSVPTDAVLGVEVVDPEASRLVVEFYGRKAGGTSVDDFTVIALPDTQRMSESAPEVFVAQTEWIVENRERLDIVFVTHLGDIVQSGNGEDEEWRRADAALSILEDPATTGLRDGIPYGLAPGNHDGTLFADETSRRYNEYFGVSRFAGRSYYGGHYGENNDNHYEVFHGGGMDFIIFHLDYEPNDKPLRRGPLEWADDLLAAHPGHRGIVSAHFLLEKDDTFSDQGAATYEQLKDNENVFLMLCGHQRTGGLRSDTFRGHTVHTVRSNYQGRIDGGGGWLRIMTFSPDNDEIRVRTYSPWLDSFDPPGDLHHLVLPYDMDGGRPFTPLGSTSRVASGTEATVSWPGLERGTAYEWYVKVSDDESTVVSPVWSLTTDGASSNDPPVRDTDPPDVPEAPGGEDESPGIIVDNGDPGTVGAGGAWKPSTGRDAWGSESLWEWRDGATYTYTVPLPRSAAYDVDLWWTAKDGRRADVPVEIEHTGGTTTIHVDQGRRGGRWNRLGRFEFDGDATVTILSDRGGDTSVSADAVRFVPSEPEASPVSDRFRRGDINADGVLNVTDGILLLGFLFEHESFRAACLESADTNNDGAVDVTDATSILGFLFLGEGAPSPPGAPPAPCGDDPDPPGAPQHLGCLRYESC